MFDKHVCFAFFIIGPGSSAIFPAILHPSIDENKHGVHITSTDRFYYTKSNVYMIWIIQGVYRAGT